MKISLNWIKDYVSLDGINPKELALKLTMSTAEVEEVIYKGNDVESVVVGKVTNIEPHPSSDKLKIVQVDTGGQTIQTVCGAPNVAKGILAPFAKIGGRILKVPRIEKTTLSGVESRGILCSGAEIGVNNDSGQLLILDETLKPGTDLKKLYGIDDVIVEIDNKSLTHRPDLWGHYGIAREVAAIFKRPLAQVERAELEPNDDLPYLKIAIEDKEKCSRYSGITVENVADNETPLDIQVRLYYCGLNPKSLLVDLSNYVMMDIGQPNHAFDNDYAQNIVVKCPPSPFKFRTLDDVERDIDTDVLMIYDRDTPVAVA
ncbi:MAG: phenylalanine--tRNA ligase subunit beta, partial [bacterium]|nr:phenylalanine--tRNA ligase subunit beta [bacterium]